MEASDSRVESFKHPEPGHTSWRVPCCQRNTSPPKRWPFSRNPPTLPWDPRGSFDIPWFFVEDLHVFRTIEKGLLNIQGMCLSLLFLWNGSFIHKDLPFSDTHMIAVAGQPYFVCCKVSPKLTWTEGPKPVWKDVIPTGHSMAIKLLDEGVYGVLSAAKASSLKSDQSCLHSTPKVWMIVWSFCIHMLLVVFSIFPRLCQRLNS